MYILNEHHVELKMVVVATYTVHFSTVYIGHFAH